MGGHVQCRSGLLHGPSESPRAECMVSALWKRHAGIDGDRAWFLGTKQRTSVSGGPGTGFTGTDGTVLPRRSKGPQTVTRTGTCCGSVPVGRCWGQLTGPRVACSAAGWAPAPFQAPSPSSSSGSQGDLSPPPALSPPRAHGENQSFLCQAWGRGGGEGSLEKFGEFQSTELPKGSPQGEGGRGPGRREGAEDSRSGAQTAWRDSSFGSPRETRKWGAGGFAIKWEMRCFPSPAKPRGRPAPVVKASAVRSACSLPPLEQGPAGTPPGTGRAAPSIRGCAHRRRPGKGGTCRRLCGLLIFSCLLKRLIDRAQRDPAQGFLLSTRWKERFGLGKLAPAGPARLRLGRRLRASSSDPTALGGAQARAFVRARPRDPAGRRPPGLTLRLPRRHVRQDRRGR